MSKHTPGPWRVVEHSWSDTGIYASKHAIAGLSIEGIADESSQSRLEAVMAANAKLIAAAPELLEALRETLIYLPEYPEDRSLREAVCKSRAAIAKATGAA